jgi:hypothetical protein
MPSAHSCVCRPAELHTTVRSRPRRGQQAEAGNERKPSQCILTRLGKGVKRQPPGAMSNNLLAGSATQRRSSAEVSGLAALRCSMALAYYAAYTSNSGTNKADGCTSNAPTTSQRCMPSMSGASNVESNHDRR